MSGIARKRWAEKAQQLPFGELAAVRARAEQWRTGLAGLTALLATATIVKGPDAAAKLPEETRTSVVSLLSWGFVLLVIASVLAMSAAFGWPRRREAVMTGERLAAWEAREARSARWRLLVAAVGFLCGLLLVGLATRKTLLEVDEPKPLVRADVGLENPVCGELLRLDEAGVALKVTDDFGDSEDKTFENPHRIVPASSCD